MAIYLDHNAGSPLRPAVRAALNAFLERDPGGNPASIHRAGQRARRELECAREAVASMIGAPPRSIVFTSGGTEANNLAILGAARESDRRQIITSPIEHSSVLAPLIELERRGFEVIQMPPDGNGLIDADALASRVSPRTMMVTLGLANAEVGTIQPVAPIAAAARVAGALLHLDAVQAIGRIPVVVDELGCDLLTLSGHKLGGPAGCGALYVRDGAALEPLIVGGPQEFGLRAGTPNLAGAIGFGAAAEFIRTSLRDETDRIATLSGQLLELLTPAIPGLRLNGPSDARLPNTLNLTFPHVFGEAMLIALDLEGVEVSMGSACAAGSVEPSHVLLAMGRDATAARSSLRLSLGWSTTSEEVARAGAIIPRVWRRVAEAEPAADRYSPAEAR
jgi:cysteine desulfurase